MEEWGRTLGTPGTEVLVIAVESPGPVGRGVGRGVAGQRRGGQVGVQALQHLSAVPGPAHPRWLPVARVHAQRRALAAPARVAHGDAQAEGGAQVEQAAPGHPLPELGVALAAVGHVQNAVPHAQTAPGALMEKSERV